MSIVDAGFAPSRPSNVNGLQGGFFPFQNSNGAIIRPAVGIYTSAESPTMGQALFGAINDVQALQLAANGVDVPSIYVISYQIGFVVSSEKWVCCLVYAYGPGDMTGNSVEQGLRPTYLLDTQEFL